MDAAQTDVTAGVSSGPLSALAEGILCPQCGYDLRGSTSPRCSECGHDLAVLRATESQIPWVHRRQIGRARAYWRTAWRVTLHNRQFCAEVARPVGYADAQRFRWVTVALAYVAILASQLAYLFSVDDPFEPVDTVEWLLIPGEVGLLLALAALTGVPSYLFHPRRAPLAVQNRAVALSYYACGPLVLLPLSLAPIAVLCLPLAFHRLAGTHISGGPFAFYILAPFASLALLVWWINLTRLASRVFHRGGRTLLVLILVPLLWTLVGGLILVGLPLLTFHVIAVFYSLR